MRKGKPEDVICDLITQLGSVSAVAFHEEVREMSLLKDKIRLWKFPPQPNGDADPVCSESFLSMVLLTLGKLASSWDGDGVGAWVGALAG